MAESIHKRKAVTNAALHSLIQSGQLIATRFSNGKRKNLRYRLTLPQPSPHAAQPAAPKNAISRVPDLMALDLWGELPRLDQIDVYMRSGWNVTPLVPFGKVPIMSREKWARHSRDEKIDLFWREPELNVGLWITQYSVFDYDSDRQPENTLVAIRGSHSHNYFIAHPEIYNTSKEVADDIDTRAPGGLIVLPPSVHESGQPYEWANLRQPKRVPDTLLTAWRNRQTFGGKTGFRLDTLPDIIRQGERDNYLWAFGRSLKASGATKQQIAYQMHVLNRERFKPQFSERVVDRKVEHVWTAPNDPEWKR